MAKKDALPALAQAAVACERNTGLPAEISLAQAAIESGWLAKAPGNNCFGIKASSTSPLRQLLRTTEWFTPGERARFLALGDGRTADLVQPPRSDAKGRQKYSVMDYFAAYSDLAGCFTDHARLITTGRPYQAAWTAFQGHHSWQQLLSDIGPIYATAPNYAANVMAIISDDVSAALQSARNATAVPA